MTVTSGFFNSVSSDRLYNAEQMSEIFDGIILDGVFSNVGNGLAVVEDSGMNIYVSSGRAWFNSTWTYNDSNYSLTIPTAHATLPRIDVIYIEINKDSGTRANSFGVLQGTPASSPSPPTWTDTSTVFKYALAHVYVGAGVTSISQSDITSKIGSVDTPYVKGPLINISTDDETIILDGGVLKLASEGIQPSHVKNKTRSIICLPGNFIVPYGYVYGQAFHQFEQYLGGYVLFSDDETSIGYGGIELPKDRVDNTPLTIKLLWFGKSTTGTVSWNIAVKPMYNGVNINTTWSTNIGNNASCSTSKEIVETTFGTTSNIVAPAPAVLGVKITRWGSAAEDTLNGVAGVHGVVIEYTADS